MSQDAIKYLETEVRPSVLTDVVAVAAYHGRRQKLGAGHFSTPRQVFCYIDHLGYIAYGGASTGRAVRFIKEFFPVSYREMAELVYVMWRHGTVHELKPVSYRAPLRGVPCRKVEVRWLSTNHNRERERRRHMLVFPMEGKPDTVYLVMNSCQLADDLLDAVDQFVERLKADSPREKRCAERIKSLAQVREYTQAGKSMAPTIKQQIRDAWAKQGGLLDKSGKVVRAHAATPNR